MRRLVKLAAGATTVVASLQALVLKVAASGYDYNYDLSDLYDYADTSAAVVSTGILGGTVGIIVLCCSLIVGFGINALIAYLVYRDAEKNKVENPILWALLSFFFTLLGLLVYLLAIRPEAIKKMEAGAPKAEAK